MNETHSFELQHRVIEAPPSEEGQQHKDCSSALSMVLNEINFSPKYIYHRKVSHYYKMSPSRTVAQINKATRFILSPFLCFSLVQPEVSIIIISPLNFAIGRQQNERASIRAQNTD